MAAVDAVQFLIEDNGDRTASGELSGFRKDFAEDKPYRSILQRTKRGLDEVLEMFDWRDDGDKWVEEYHKTDGGPDFGKLVKYRRRVAFCIGGWREFNEDFGRGDVSCLRDLRTPFITSRSPLKQSKREFDENGK